MTLTSNTHGKGRVRVMRVHREGDRHEVRELTIQAMLKGDFSRAFTHADNRRVVLEHQRLSVRGTMHLYLGMQSGLETFDDQEIDPGHLRKQLGEAQFWGPTQFVHQCPSPSGRNQHLGRTGLPMYP